MRKGKKKGRYFAFCRCVEGGKKKAKACKGGWKSTFTEKHYNAGMWQKYDKKAEIRENLCLDCVNLRETRGAQTPEVALLRPL